MKLYIYICICFIKMLEFKKSKKWKNTATLPTASGRQTRLPSVGSRQRSHASTCCATWERRLAIWSVCRPQAVRKEVSSRLRTEKFTDRKQSEKVPSLCRPQAVG